MLIVRFGIELLFVLLQQEVTEALERTQRRTHVVGDAVGERFQFGHGFLKRGGALGDGAFQRGRVLAQFSLGPSQRFLRPAAFDQVRRLDRA